MPEDQLAQMVVKRPQCSLMRDRELEDLNIRRTWTGTRHGNHLMSAFTKPLDNRIINALVSEELHQP